MQSATPPRALSQDMNNLDVFQDFAQVYESKKSLVNTAVHRKTGVTYVVKAYKRETLSVADEQKVLRELQINQKLDHDHVIKVHAYFEDDDNIYIVQELAQQGDLFDVANKFPLNRMPEPIAAQVVLQVVLGVEYIHGLKILHRDLKPENIVMTEDNVVKLCDFGLAIDIDKEKAVTKLGTLQFMAPEILDMEQSREQRMMRLDSSSESGLYDSKVDIWAIGCLAYELLAGYSPFDGENHEDITTRILGGKMIKLPTAVSCSEDVLSFITMCLNTNPRQRPTATQLLAHPWMTATVRRMTYFPVLLGPRGSRKVMTEVVGRICETATLAAARATQAQDEPGGESSPTHAGSFRRLIPTMHASRLRPRPAGSTAGAEPRHLPTQASMPQQWLSAAQEGLPPLVRHVGGGATSSPPAQPRMQPSGAFLPPGWMGKPSAGSSLADAGDLATHHSAPRMHRTAPKVLPSQASLPPAWLAAAGLKGHGTGNQ